MECSPLSFGIFFVHRASQAPAIRVQDLGFRVQDLVSRIHWRGGGDLEPIEDAADPEPTDYAADTKHTALFSTDVRNFKFWRLQEAGFLLSDEGIPPFPLQWGWSVRHFPLEWRWHSIPTLRCTGESTTSLRGNDRPPLFILRKVANSLMEVLSPGSRRRGRQRELTCDTLPPLGRPPVGRQPPPPQHRCSNFGDCKKHESF